MLRSTTFTVTLLVLACFSLVRSAAGSSVQSPGDIFKVDGKLAAVALLTTPSDGEPRPIQLAHNAPMLRMLDGQIAEIDRRSITTLRRFAIDSISLGTGAEHVSTLHLLSSDGQDRMLELLDDGGDLVWARDSAGEGLVTLPRKRLDALVPGWDRHASGGISADLPLGETVDMPGPYLQGSVKLNSRVIRDRLDGGDKYYPISGLKRKLDEELLWIRLPKGHDPTRPAGIMVWVSPMPTWRIPQQFHDTLDELGFIACGADSAGNPRNVTERLQLMFDAIENVRARYAVDDQRIYVTGFSGGGRCSSMLHLGWPEVFAGSIPIVGLNTYHRLENWEPGKIIPAQVGRPKGRRLDLAKANRMWAFTGETDGNRYEMEHRVRRLEFDGFNATLTTVPGIGHEMPPVEELREAIRWVDEPRRSQIDAQRELAQAKLDSLIAEHTNQAPLTTQARAELVEITRKWPWTEAAWQAAERLGYTRPRD